MVRPVRLFESSIPSGNAYKVSLMLAHLGIEVPHVQLDILARPPETRRPEFLARNPNGRIPLLELDDGTHLPESNAILCLLADGTPYLPADPLARARALAWMFFEQYSHEPYVAVLKFWTYWAVSPSCRPPTSPPCRPAARPPSTSWNATSPRRHGSPAPRTAPPASPPSASPGAPPRSASPSAPPSPPGSPASATSPVGSRSAALDTPRAGRYKPYPFCGSNSVVECNLAKV